MKEVQGKYTSAKIFVDTIEDGVIKQTLAICDHPIFEDAQVRIMPDCHVGKGCTIGFTSTLPKDGEEIIKAIEPIATILNHLKPVYNFKAKE